jgi:YVTN family beta-propeller protein
MQLIPLRHGFWLGALTALVAGCGGGGDAAVGTNREAAKAIAQPSQSVWSPVQQLPLVPTALANLPDGKVLMWSAGEKFSFEWGNQMGRTYSVVFDPATGTVTERAVTETGHDMFCPGTTNLEDGRLLVNGGISTTETSIYDPASGTWSSAAKMNIARGYQANTLLRDGSVLTLGGSWSGGWGGKHGEVWNASSGWRRLPGVPIDPFFTPEAINYFGGDSHFWLIPAGNGRVLHAGPGPNMHWIDTRADGRTIPVGPRGDDEFSISGTTVMFNEGRVLKAGGSPGYAGYDANTNAFVIDVRGGGVSTRRTAPMAYRRGYHNSVVLPNGQVLLIGGQTYLVGFNDNNSVLAPELWDPATETFTPLPPIAVPRNYHSVAILLPDARVLSAGGGLCGAGCSANHPDLQVLTPHYLLNPDGSPAQRPSIASAPASARYGETIQVETSSPVASFAIVRMSSTTHTVNNDQRRLELGFRSTGSNRYEVDVPTNPGWALPGDWMLFALNAEGVPSIAKLVRISRQGVPVYRPVDADAAVVGTPVTVQPVVDAFGAVGLTHEAVGLPPGISIDPLTGRLSGTPTAAGRYPVRLVVRAGAVASSVEFLWEVVGSSAVAPGLQSEYYAGTALSGSPIRTGNEAVDFNWGANSPAAGLPVDGFSVRWTGWIDPPESGEYVLQTLASDGVRVWVNDALVIDRWSYSDWGVDSSPSLPMTAGQRVPIRLEYFEGSGNASISLRWIRPGTSVSEPIPISNLRGRTGQTNRAPIASTPAMPPLIQGQAVSFLVPASDPDGDALRYSAFGLPAGLGVDANSGVVSGAPSAAGTYSAVISVSDGRGASTIVSFPITVQPGGPAVLPIPASPVGTGAAASFVATMEAPGSYTYQWDFGDGTPVTTWSESPSVTHTFASPGVFLVTITARTPDGRIGVRSFWQSVEGPKGPAGRSSSAIAFEPRSAGSGRVWAVNPDNDSVSVFDASTNSRVAEIPVGTRPRTLAVAPDGRVWVVNQDSATISIVSPASMSVTQTLSLARASQPYGVVIDASGQVYVTHEATGLVVRMSGSGAVNASVTLASGIRHLALNGSGSQLLITRFITPPMPGESTAAVSTTSGGAPRGGEMIVIDTTNGAMRTIVLQHSERADSTVQGRGVPNYLGAPVVSPDGATAWVPSKQDNVKRGKLRDGQDLTFENTVRAVTSRIVLSQSTDDLAGRIDHDNASLASAATFHPGGAYLFVALETSRQVAVVDAARQRELFRVDTGRAPQGVVVSPDGLTLYVHNFMDRSVTAFDLTRLVQFGEPQLTVKATMSSVTTDKLAAQVLKGKQLFYDARDVRLARDAYMSCATCHNDGGHDGRTWDLTGFGEGLRNTISLRGRSGAQGRLHWSANFDEVHDFEGQIRRLAGGTGLLTDEQFNTGTRSQPLGDRKAGLSADLDALAAYVSSLSTFDATPYRNADGSLSSAGASGRTVFQSKCATCHGGADYTDSASGTLHNIGTLKATSGSRSGSALTGIDAPTLRDAWATAPYLHDGSAPTLADAVAAHAAISLTATERTNVVEFVRQIGREEPGITVAPPPPPPPPPPPSTPGLLGQYFGNSTLSGSPVLARNEAVNFNWGSGSPASTVTSNYFSARWTGFLTPPTTGTYRFRTYSDEGVRVWVNGAQVINNWTAHTATTNTSGSMTLNAGQRYPVTIEFYERTGSAVMQWRWLAPGTSSYVAVPASVLSAQ